MIVSDDVWKFSNHLHVSSAHDNSLIWYVFLSSSRITHQPPTSWNVWSGEMTKHCKFIKFCVRKPGPCFGMNIQTFRESPTIRCSIGYVELWIGSEIQLAPKMANNIKSRTSWWFQPSQIGSFPQIGVKIKKIETSSSLSTRPKFASQLKRKNECSCFW